MRSDEIRYLQFFVNAAVVVFVLYLAVQFVQTVQRDVRDRMSEASVGQSSPRDSTVSWLKPQKYYKK